MEFPRPTPARAPGRIQLGKGPFALLLSLLFFFGLLAGFFLTSHLDPFHVRLKENPFSPEDITSLPEGAAFEGLDELDDLPKADRERYRALLDEEAEGKRESALQTATALAESHGKNPLVAGTAAYLYLQSLPGFEPQTSRAAALLAPALAGKPGNPWLLYVAGLLQEKSGQVDSALALYKQAVDRAPHFAFPYAAMGRLQLGLGAPVEAVGNLRKAIALHLTLPERYRGPGTALPMAEPAPFDWLATHYMQSGAVDSARMSLEYGMETGWATPRSALVQAWVWESSGFLHKADSAYRALLAADPENPEYRRALVTLGWKPFGVRASGGDRGKDSKAGGADAVFALSLLDPLARQYPKNAALWMALGQAYYHRGLFAMATECFDSSLKADPGLPGLSEKRDLAYEAALRESAWALRNGKGARRPGPKAPLSEEETTPVVLPSAIALLGTYGVPWGSTPVEVRSAYPAKTFRNLPGGDLMDEFVLDGVHHQYLLAFRDGRLWGVRVFVTDSAGTGGDLFGRLIRTKTKISGEGKGTGEAACPGFLPFQGAIWENDDSFEFMAQFAGKENQVRLARMHRDHLPHNRRLCDLVPFLKTETWEGPSASSPKTKSVSAASGAGRSAAAKPAPAKPSPAKPVPAAQAEGAAAGASAAASLDARLMARPRPRSAPIPIAPFPDSDTALPSIVTPPGVDPYESAPDVTSE